MKAAILEKITSLEKKFAFLFDKLKVTSTQKIVEKYIQPVDVPLELPVALKG